MPRAEITSCKPTSHYLCACPDLDYFRFATRGESLLPLSAAIRLCSPRNGGLKQIRVFQLRLQVLGYGRTMITPTIPNSSCSTHLYW